jgi:hypothetical protein
LLPLLLSLAQAANSATDFTPLLGLTSNTIGPGGCAATGTDMQTLRTATIRMQSRVIGSA